MSNKIFNSFFWAVAFFLQFSTASYAQKANIQFPEYTRSDKRAHHVCDKLKIRGASSSLVLRCERAATGARFHPGAVRSCYRLADAYEFFPEAIECLEIIRNGDYANGDYNSHLLPNACNRILTHKGSPEGAKIMNSCFRETKDVHIPRHLISPCNREGTADSIHFCISREAWVSRSSSPKR